MDAPTDCRTVVIAGAGPVGFLQACYLAQKGFNVEIYEKRAQDKVLAETIHKQKDYQAQGLSSVGRPFLENELNVSDGGYEVQRSINLALSERGRAALRELDLETAIVENGWLSPMYSRMIHPNTTQGKSLYSVPYGKPSEYISSISRRTLNNYLGVVAASYPNTSTYFDHSLVSIDLNLKPIKLIFEYIDENQNLQTKVVFAAFVFGCDGANSAVRSAAIELFDLSASRVNIEHGYKELCMTAAIGESHVCEGCLKRLENSKNKRDNILKKESKKEEKKKSKEKKKQSTNGKTRFQNKRIRFYDKI